MVVLIGKGRVGGRILGLATTVVVIRVVTQGWFVYGRVDSVVLIGLHGGMTGARRVVVGTAAGVGIL